MNGHGPLCKISGYGETPGCTSRMLSSTRGKREEKTMYEATGSSWGWGGGGGRLPFHSIPFWILQPVNIIKENTKHLNGCMCMKVDISRLKKKKKKDSCRMTYDENPAQQTVLRSQIHIQRFKVCPPSLPVLEAARTTFSPHEDPGTWKCLYV